MRLLSILMPVYNEREKLEKCVDSVLRAPLPQDFQRELIVVDDASTDGSAR
jgi:glycosyltransferase involved in cell wall biosynthesis